MFDIGFTEFLLVAVVGLLVIGPDRLPETIRTCSAWLRKAKEGYAAVKASLEKELQMDEIRAQVRNDSIVAEFKEQAGQLEALGSGIQQSNIDLMDSFSFSEEQSSNAQSNATSEKGTT